MKIEISGRTGENNRVVRVTVGDHSETMTLGEFSRLVARPLPMIGKGNVADLRSVGDDPAS